jgi:hypothetical protein
LDDAEYHLEECLDRDEDSERAKGLAQDEDGTSSASSSSYIFDQSLTDDESDSCSSSSSFTDVQLSGYDDHTRLAVMASSWLRFLAAVHTEFKSCAETGLKHHGFAQVFIARINSSCPNLSESAVKQLLFLDVVKQLLFLHGVEFIYDKVSFLVM